jgi:predicted ATPase
VPVEFTRSRPYRKNDNAHVEQKQWTHVRQLLGYDRFENRRLVALIDDLYRNEWRAMQNFFQPTMQLISKEREGGHIRRYHGAPRTPYQRLIDSPAVPLEGKQQLRREFASLDPFDLRQAIETKLRAIFRLARNSKKGRGKAHRHAESSAGLSAATTR